jgi:hypothetical protein
LSQGLGVRIGMEMIGHITSLHRIGCESHRPLPDAWCENWYSEADWITDMQVTCIKRNIILRGSCCLGQNPCYPAPLGSRFRDHSRTRWTSSRVRPESIALMAKVPDFYGK